MQLQVVRRFGYGPCQAFRGMQGPVACNPSRQHSRRGGTVTAIRVRKPERLGARVAGPGSFGWLGSGRPDSMRDARMIRRPADDGGGE